jgi:hypothetical protein
MKEKIQSPKRQLRKTCNHYCVGASKPILQIQTCLIIFEGLTKNFDSSKFARSLKRQWEGKGSKIFKLLAAP